MMNDSLYAMMRLITIFVSCMFAQSIWAQISSDTFLLDEKQDSILPLLIKPIKRECTKDLLKRVIERIQYDLRQPNNRKTKDDADCKVRKYQVDASFNQDPLLPFSASLLFTAEAGIGLKNVKEERISFEGTNELTPQDCSLIKSNLIQFVTLSPIHAHKAYWESYRAVSPLLDAKETMRCYDVTADSIADAKGRSVLRIHFTWKTKQDKFFCWELYQGHISGTAFFDSQSLRLKQFSGMANMPSAKYLTSLHYNIEYSKKGKRPVVRRIQVTGTKGNMTMKANVQEAAIVPGIRH